MKTLYIATWITDDGSSEFYPFVDDAKRSQHDLCFDFLEHFAKEMGRENEVNYSLEELKMSVLHEVYDLKDNTRYVINLNK